MKLVQQLQGVAYSFIFGLLFSFVYGFINRLFYKYRKGIIRFILQIFIGLAFGFIYYYGILIINNGVIRLYFIASIIMGYIIYEHYYALPLLIIIERIIKVIKRILKPIYFIFNRLRVIMKKMKKVIKWPKRKKEKSLEQQSDLDI